MNNLINTLFELEFHKTNNDKRAALKLKNKLIREVRGLITELESGRAVNVGNMTGTDLIHNATDLIHWLNS